MDDQGSPRVKLELHGKRAPFGIELDSLENFIAKFRTALREFERATSEREHEVGRGGHPDARSKAVTALRLVEAHSRSADLTLEAGPVQNGDLRFGVDEPAIRNLENLVAAFNRGELPRPVIENLDEARRALGDDGHFGVALEGRPYPPADVTKEAIAALTAKVPTPPTASQRTVFGRLHLIEIEGAPRVEIRGTDGYNWVCAFPAELEETVFGLIGRRVVARGLGLKEKPGRGSMELQGIEPLEDYDQEPLFSYETVPFEELEKRQGISRPQGIRNLAGDDLPDDEATQRFLDSIFED